MRGRAMLSKEAAHMATGMKVSEIVDIEPIDGGYRVHTHDGQHIDLDAVEEPEPLTAESEPAAEDKKPAPSRGRKA